MRITAFPMLLIPFASTAISNSDFASSLKRRTQTNLVLPANGGQLSRHDQAAVNGLLQFSAQPNHPVNVVPTALHMLPETVIIDYLLPYLPFKEAMNLNDTRLTEEDIITHCAKSNAEDIVNYIFRDLDKNDHIITDEVRLKNFRILLNSEEVQEQIEKDNHAVPHNRKLLKWRILDPNHFNSIGVLIPHPLLHSIQVGVERIAENGKIELLKELLHDYSEELSQVTIPLKAIFIAAQKGDSGAVDLILGNVRAKGTLSPADAVFHDNWYIHHALRGSISGLQFEIFKQIIGQSDPIIRVTAKEFPPLIARDLLNKNLRSWLDYAILNGNYRVDKKQLLHFYVNRSYLKEGNPIKPSLENLQYLMHLPYADHITIEFFIFIMRDADNDILELLARQFLDPLLSFTVKVPEFRIDGRKKRSVVKIVYGFEALNYAIDMVNSYKSNRFENVRAALIKVKGEFDSFTK